VGSRRCPAREDELHPGVTLECPGGEEAGERAVGPPRHLEQEDDLLDVGRPHRGRGAARVVVHGHAELFAHGPERVVVLDVMQLRNAAAGRRSRQQHAAPQAVLVGPADLRDGRVDVVQHDLRDPGPPAARLPAEVGEPAVVRLQPGPATREVAGVGRRGLGRQRDLRKNGGTVFGKTTSATMPSDSRSASRRSESSCGRRGRRSGPRTGSCTSPPRRRNRRASDSPGRAGSPADRRRHGSRRRSRCSGRCRAWRRCDRRSQAYRGSPGAPSKSAGCVTESHGVQCVTWVAAQSMCQILTRGQNGGNDGRLRH